MRAWRGGTRTDHQSTGQSGRVSGDSRTGESALRTPDCGRVSSVSSGPGRGRLALAPLFSRERARTDSNITRETETRKSVLYHRTVTLLILYIAICLFGSKVRLYSSAAELASSQTSLAESKQTVVYIDLLAPPLQNRGHEMSTLRGRSCAALVVVLVVRQERVRDGWPGDFARLTAQLACHLAAHRGLCSR